MNRTSGLIILVNHSHLRSIINNNPFTKTPFETPFQNQNQKAMAQHPPSYGTNFTPTIHRKPSGPTDPTNISLPAPFIVAIIGAGKGLGRQIALSYAKAGASGIVISSRTQTDLDSLEGELKAVGKKGGVEVWKKVCDVQKMKEVEEVARGTGEKFGRVDVVVSFFCFFSFLFSFLLYIYIFPPLTPLPDRQRRHNIPLHHPHLPRTNLAPPHRTHRRHRIRTNPQHEPPRILARSANFPTITP